MAILFKEQKSLLVIDIGKAPDRKFSKDYQAGLFSFEFSFLGEKVITNSGYFQDYKHQLNIISKSTATHSNPTLNNTSTAKFERDKNGQMLVNKNFKILDREIINEKNFGILRLLMMRILNQMELSMRDN